MSGPPPSSLEIPPLRRGHPAVNVALGVAALVLGLVRGTWLTAALGVVVAATAPFARRPAVVLTPTHLVRGVMRRRAIPWTQVRAVRASPYLPRVVAVLADGRTVPLRALRWHAPRPEGQAPPRSAQLVVDWARGHGYDVALTES